MGIYSVASYAVARRQAALIAQWMNVGFIHGVMNTDNMAISGETIDYGPCAFMDDYNPAQVYSSIDEQGRYAYGNQPNVALWNLAQFGSCLVPLFDSEAAAVAALPPKLREVILLRHYDDLPPRAIATRLSLSIEATGKTALPSGNKPAFAC